MHQLLSASTCDIRRAKSRKTMEKLGSDPTNPPPLAFYMPAATRASDELSLGSLSLIRRSRRRSMTNFASRLAWSLRVIRADLVLLQPRVCYAARTGVEPSRALRGPRIARHPCHAPSLSSQLLTLRLERGMYRGLCCASARRSRHLPPLRHTGLTALPFAPTARAP